MCVDQVEVGFDAYLQSTNGNPLTYDTVRGHGDPGRAAA